MEPTTQQDRKWISWLIIVGLIVISTAVGVKLPDLPPPPEGASRGTTNLDTLEVESFLRPDAQTALTVTDGTAFTPTGTYQPITAAGAVTPTVSTTGFSAGDLLVLINTGSNAITLADSGTAKLASAAALGQYDSITLIFDGTNWIEFSRSNN